MPSPDPRPLVSVVIPSYNYGRFVVEAVKSALAQTYRPIEVIVVDDGSTDDTAERLAAYADRIRYIRQENSGLSAARNTGIRAATGEWVALLDADDLWHRQKLEVQLRAGERASVGLIGSPGAKTPPTTEDLPADPPAQKVGVRDFLLSARMGPSSALIRRTCFESVGYFDESLRSIEDRDMWLRLAARYECVLVESPCWWYRTHAAQMSRHADRMFENYRRVLTKFFDEHPEYRRLYRLAMSYLHYDAGWCYLAEGRRIAAVAQLMRSAWYQPVTLGDERIVKRFPRAKIAARALIGSTPC
jgi:glycosyltransferase involved in cell wall biosynthesis